MAWGRRAGWVVAGGLVLLAGWGLRVAVRAPDAAAERARAEGDATGDRGGAGVAARDNDSASRRVRAQVIDDDDAPLEGGRVSLRCLDDDEVAAIPDGTVALDDEGAFEAPGCRGIVCVELHHPFAVAADAWVLRPGEPGVLRATGLPRLRGTVLDRRGEPIAAARISVGPALDADPEGSMPTIGASTTTDADGTFSFALLRRPPCDPCTEAERGCDDAPLALHDRVRIAVHADGFAPARAEVEVDAERGDTDMPTVTLAPPGDVLSGTLVDPDGQPYPRATLIARASADPSEQHEAKLDGEHFVFESLGAGPYELRALQDGVELATASAARPGDDLALRGALPAVGPDVVLTITEDGLPRAGVTVDGGPFRGARTDMHGQVRALQAMPGDYTLSLRRAGAPSLRRPLTIPPRTAADRAPSAPQPPLALAIALASDDVHP